MKSMIELGKIIYRITPNSVPMRVGVDKRQIISQSMTGLSAKGCLFLREIRNLTTIEQNTNTELQAEVSVLLKPKQ
jgi:hypothetical protein